MRKFLKISGIAFIILVFFFLPFPDALKLDILLIAIYLIYKIFSFILRKILWKIRNKLILSYLFLTIIPLLLFVLLAYSAAYFYFTKYGNYIVTNNLKYRLEFIKRVVDSNRVGKGNFNIKEIKNKTIINRFIELNKRIKIDKKTDINSGILIYKQKLNFYYFSDNSLFLRELTDDMLESIKDFTLWKPKFLIIKSDWSMGGKKEITFDTKNNSLNNNSSGKSKISINERSDKENKESVILNLSKFQFVTFLNLIDIGQNKIRPVFFKIEFDNKLAIKKIKSTVLSGTIIATQKIFLYIMFILVTIFTVLYIISFILGIVLIKSITSSISNLYEGTKKIIEKNFQFKIHKIPSDQLGEVALSFNSMADSINNLLEEEKEKERLKREIELAAKMQNRLLPRDDLTEENISLSGLSIFAQEVGGDYYDYFETSDGRIFFSIADVSGKGMTAAFYMAEVKGIIRSFAETSFNLKEITKKVNNIIYNSLEKISFVTGILGYIDKDRKYIRYIRCGHPLPILIKNRGEVKEIDSSGVALGLKDNISNNIEVKEILLEEQDTIIFYTDGLSEMVNEKGELFTGKGIISVFKEVEINSIKDIKKRLKDAIYSYITEDFLDDDITLLIIRKEY